MSQFAKMGPVAAIIKLWSELTSVQRTVVISFVFVSIIVLVLVAMFVTKPRMSVLFSNLESEDAGAIVQKLDEEKTPYEISQDGGTIKVPDNKVYDLRLKMATDGLPQGGSVGYELFDKQNFGMTEFVEKVKLTQAIQGELTRTIMQLSPVLNARVHIVLPQEKIFSSEQQPTTASVLLKLRRGSPLTDNQIASVVHLVASSVEGLKPEDVTVLDTMGNMLNEGKPGSGASGSLTGNQVKQTKQFESDLAQNLQSMLARVVGSDKAVVRVTADLNFDKEATTSEKYLPVSTTNKNALGVATKQDVTTEKYNGSVVPPSGLPGNGLTSGKSKAASGDNYTKTTESAEYQVTKEIKQIESATGRINKLYVSVLVDENVDPTKVAAIQDAVSVAAGIDKARGDQVTVQRMAFDKSEQTKLDKEMASASQTELYMTIGKNAGAVILLLAFLFLLSKIVKQIKLGGDAQFTRQENESYSRSEKASISQGPMTSPAEMIQKATGQIYSSESMLKEQQEADENYATALAPEPIPSEVSQSSPEDLARLVRQWMSEEA